MKRLWNIIIVIFLLFLNIGIVKANVTGKINLTGPSTVAPGETFTIKIGLSLNSINKQTEELMYCNGRLIFDEKYITYVKYSMDAVLTGMPHGTESFVSGFGFSFGNKSKFYGGHMITVTFKVKDDAPENLNLKFTVESHLTRISTTYEVPEHNNKKYIDAPTTGSSITMKTKIPKSSDATLKLLNIKDQTLNKTFNSNETSYEITVENNIKEVEIDAAVNHSKSKLSIQGNKDLQIGENKATITVTAENDTKKIYTIKIIRKASGNNNLTTLGIEGKTKETFNSQTLKYTMIVPNETTSLVILPKLDDETATFEITGNEDLKIGNNIIQIKVIAENKEEKIYEIDVTRQDVKVEETKTNMILIIGSVVGGLSLIAITTFVIIKKKKII